MKFVLNIEVPDQDTDVFIRELEANDDLTVHVGHHNFSGRLSTYQRLYPHETIVVIGQGYWGKGVDLAEAKSVFRRQGGQLNAGYTILTFDSDTDFLGVDGMGRASWRHRDGKSKPHPPKQKDVPATKISRVSR